MFLVLAGFTDELGSGLFSFISPPKKERQKKTKDAPDLGSDSGWLIVLFVLPPFFNPYSPSPFLVSLSIAATWVWG